MAGDIPDVPSPGGWLQTYGVRVARGLAIGLAGGATAAVTIFGTLNGGQAIQYIESPLLQVKGQGGAFAAINPLTESAAVVSVEVFVAKNPAPVTRLSIGTSTGATYSGSNLMNRIDISGAPRLLPWTLTGGALSGIFGNGSLAGVVLAPSTASTANKRYITGSYGFGSGQVVGNYAGYARIGIMPCSLGGLIKC